MQATIEGIEHRIGQIRDALSEYKKALMNRESDDPVTEMQYTRWILEEQNNLIAAQDQMIKLMDKQANEQLETLRIAACFATGESGGKSCSHPQTMTTSAGLHCCHCGQKIEIFTS